jgi:hypothetical protein
MLIALPGRRFPPHLAAAHRPAQYGAVITDREYDVGVRHRRDASEVLIALPGRRIPGFSSIAAAEHGSSAPHGDQRPLIWQHRDGPQIGPSSAELVLL